MSLQYLEKEFRDKVDFLHAHKHQSFPQVEFDNLGLKAFYKMILSPYTGITKHCQSA